MKNIKTRTKVLIAIGGLFALTALIGILFGSAGRNDEFQPQN